jgi:hypothetical protein
MVNAMCTTIAISPLTFDSLLQDPLIQMVMRSDRVTEQDHSELWQRVKDCVVARPPFQARSLMAGVV